MIPPELADLDDECPCCGRVNVWLRLNPWLKIPVCIACLD